MIEPNYRQAYFSPTKSLSRALSVLAVLLCLLSFFRTLMNFSQASIYQSMESMRRYVYSQDFMLSMIMSLVISGVSISYAVVFFVWVNKSNKNLESLGVKNKIFSSGWSVGWFFIPFANFVKPYQVMREIWDESSRIKVRVDNYDYTKKAPGSTVLLWWLTCIFSNIFAGIISFYVSYEAGIFHNYTSSMKLLMLAAVLFGIIGYIFTVYIVHKMTNFQIEKYETIKAQEQSIPDDFRTDDITNSPDKFPPTYNPFS